MPRRPAAPAIASAPSFSCRRRTASPLAAAERADLTFAYIFNPTASGVVNSVTGAIQFPAVHGLSTGDAVIYDNGHGASVGGLVNGTTYYVVKVSDTTVKLAAAYAQAVMTSPTVITLSTAGITGDQHSLRLGVVPSGVCKLPLTRPQQSVAMSSSSATCTASRRARK